MTSKRIWMSILCSVILQTCLAAQSGPADDQGPTTVMARLSYSNTYVTVSGQQRSPRICFEVYRNGRYRLAGIRTVPQEPLVAHSHRTSQLRSLSLMKKLDFENGGGGVIRNGSESFVAEIVRGNETKRYLWVDPDHQRPFPDSRSALLTGCQGFTPQGASPVTVLN